MGDAILCKVHESATRWVVALCDEELYGRKLLEGKRALDLGTAFFKGEPLTKEEAGAEIERCVAEDATFNIVGKRAVALAKEKGIIEEDGIITIQGIPVALVLL